MAYLLTDIEITAPLPQLALSSDHTGLGLIIRRYGKPIGFLMRSLPSHTVWEISNLEQWITTELAEEILQESMFDELISDELISNAEATSIPSLTVAICTKDRPENLKRCLQSLLPLQQSETTDSLLFQILVVDNAPSDQQTHEIVKALSSVTYVHEPKPGLNFARNCALHHASGELLAFLDDDVVVDNAWLQGLREAWVENPDAAAFTGLVLPFELATEAQVLFEREGGFRRGFEKIRYGKTLLGNPLYPCGAGIFGAGCNMAFRRSVLQEIGGFDDALDTGQPLPGGGDLDMFYRIVRAGYPLVYEPQYLVFHQHRQELVKLRHQYWTWGLGFMAFIVKSYNSDPTQRTQLRRLVRWWFVYQLKRLKQGIRGRHPLPVGMICAELWGGIVGLFGEYQRSLHRIQQIRRQWS